MMASRLLAMTARRPFELVARASERTEAERKLNAVVDEYIAARTVAR